MDTLYIGIDWSEAKHDVCILNQAGAILKEFIHANGRRTQTFNA
jgi:hypothetical protein